MKAARTREVSIAILEALGAPVEGCVGVEVDLPNGDYAMVSITYHITDGMLIRLGQLMEKHREQQ